MRQLHLGFWLLLSCCVLNAAQAQESPGTAAESVDQSTPAVQKSEPETATEKSATTARPAIASEESSEQTPVAASPVAGDTTAKADSPPVVPSTAMQKNPEVVKPLSEQTGEISILPPEGSIPLLVAENFQSEWVFYSAEQNSPPSATWVLTPPTGSESPILVCKGKPFGYLRTKRRFKNYDFGFEWRYPAGDTSNSGVLLYVEGEDMIWPTSVQVQLHLSGAGSVIPLSGAKLKRRIEVREKLANHGTWHHCQIQSNDGAVTVVINGKPLGTVPECLPQEGFVALQSQGAEIQFRNVWIKQRN